jgi:hypothetical protein
MFSATPHDSIVVVEIRRTFQRNEREALSLPGPTHSDPLDRPTVVPFESFRAVLHDPTLP